MSEEKKSAVTQKAAGASVSRNASTGEDYFADFDFDSLSIDMRLMLKNGVHFGHQKSRKNPKMDEYIFGQKNGVNIIDLVKTSEKLKESMDFVEETVASGQEILFIGTKKQAKKIVESAAKKCTMPYVVERWLGGTFTNFRNISGRTKYLRDGQEKMKQGGFSQYTKFEQMKIAEELERLEQKMGGIKHMTKLPGAIFVTGIQEDQLAIQEARKKKIPIIALADTNVDPSVIDYPIPANEDAVSSLKLMVAFVVKAVLEGKKKMGIVKEKVEQKANENSEAAKNKK